MLIYSNNNGSNNNNNSNSNNNNSNRAAVKYKNIKKKTVIRRKHPKVARGINTNQQRLSCENKSYLKSIGLSLNNERYTKYKQLSSV